MKAYYNWTKMWQSLPELDIENSAAADNNRTVDVVSIQFLRSNKVRSFQGARHDSESRRWLQESTGNH